MILNDAMILLFAFIAFIALIGLTAFMIFLNRIPRWWRLGLYLLYAGLALFGADFFYFVSGFGRNIDSGERAQHFFESLQQQLATGTVHREFLELPGYAAGAVLSLFAAAAVIAGAVFAWRKIRWYSRHVLCVAFFMTQFVFWGCVQAKDSKSIEVHNEMRRLVYGLIEQKRTEGVTDLQMADSIAEHLKGFRYSYENRREEIESEKRIENALKKLRRAASEKVR